MGVRHLIDQVIGSGGLLAAGRISLDGTTLTMTNISSPQYLTADITAYRLGAGRYQVNLANFRGPSSIVIPVVSAGSTATAAVGGVGNGATGLSAGIALNSYTSGTDTYGFVIAIATGNSFVDADAYWVAFGF